MDKKKLARWFVDWTDGWNRELHEAIEAKIQAAYSSMYSNPEGGKVDLEQMDNRVREMRNFYYARMTNTSMLLMTIVALAVSVLALIVSILH
ncbi:hypothetical protein WJ85_34540 [Burkholderia ubonensis]|uniref:Uncharacterized protein n=2 Tax=Burkholderia cepacia complex TaxID=87882 RepID=A0A1B4PLP9_BURCE|nr:MULTISPECIES: hypothetical protein [Burkholderia cepacia complex]AOK14845.1 hypothetical protein WT26_02030 [Burkholderia cepacia]AOK21564.1 hypothetical protein WK67_02025 [Burkholderia ubonensis]KVO32176.1 hypothetical protein WJ76_18580 [Burkholderia ubonensis]KVP26113.1 hypothetical protein WJ85_34540 [Burkholderia ubonensis]